MEYIAHRRFKGKALCGFVNIPATTACSEQDGVIYWNGKAICKVNSENSHRYFSRNDDGRGMERGRLTRAITTTLEVRDDHYQERWDKVWEDPACQQFKRRTHDDDFWFWNFAFFNAEIFSLEHIAELVGAKGGDK